MFILFLLFLVLFLNRSPALRLLSIYSATLAAPGLRKAYITQTLMYLCLGVIVVVQGAGGRPLTLGLPQETLSSP